VILKDKTGDNGGNQKISAWVRSQDIVKGRIDEAFPAGDQKLTVFVEESVETKDGNK
jgi:hypothetical protein